MSFLTDAPLGKIGWLVREGFRMHDVRRSRRVLATVPLEIIATGEVISASTGVINLNGALIFCFVNWPEGSELKFRNPENGVEVRGRVVWAGNVAPNGLHKLGVEFAGPSPELWGSHYDPNSLDTPETAEKART
jgi:hypothetical protein